MRGIAALGVLVFHVFLVLPVAGVDSPHEKYIDPFNTSLLAQHVFLSLFNGRGLVTLFFVLSGCVLALSLDRQRSFGLLNLPGYWVRRVFRLYPLLIVAATLGALLQWQVEPGPLPSASAWADWHYNISRRDLPAAWAKNAVGWSNSLNSPAWSIRVEIIASMLFPAIYWLTKQPRRATLAALAFLLLMFLPASLADPSRHLNVFAITFFAGALVPLYGKRLVDKFVTFSQTKRRVSLTFILVIFMFSRHVIDPTTVSPPVVLIETLCSTFLVALALFRPTPAWLQVEALQYLGRISYGIYLLHLIVIFALVYYFLGDSPPPDTQQALIFGLLLFAGTLFITLPLAALLYRVVELPMQRFGGAAGRRLESRFGRNRELAS